MTLCLCQCLCLCLLPAPIQSVGSNRRTTPQLPLHAAPRDAVHTPLTTRHAIACVQLRLSFARRALRLPCAANAMYTGDGKWRTAANVTLARLTFCELGDAHAPSQVAHKRHPAAPPVDNTLDAGFSIDWQGLAAAGLSGAVTSVVGLVTATASSSGWATTRSGGSARPDPLHCRSRTRLKTATFGRNSRTGSVLSPGGCGAA